MKNVYKIVIASILILPAIVYWDRQKPGYPPVWDEIHLGMTRQEVYRKTGLPVLDKGDSRGTTWEHKAFLPIRRHYLVVTFEEAGAAELRIVRVFGTNQHYFEESLRHQSPSK